MRSLGKKPYFEEFSEAKKANWRFQLHAQRSKMYSFNLGPSEKNSFCAKAQRNPDMCDPYGKNTILRHSKGLKKLTGAFSCMHKGPKCFQSLWDHPKKFLLCKSTKKSRYVRSLGKKSHFEAFSEAKKANWRSRLHAQRSKMHSIPLGPSQKNSFCAKAQRRRDMCDP